ncbi:LysR family transcriptional regulator, hydrogen peroxide-inducible genes activator [Pseudoxanthobacter soli DSM 19599]|uniref:LysR family transcriptional regulator, hydrogen peroxide-inducible genes activator n=1 Tax=Pseudoxanthobacter soli DSM 19599 TaxID=1123029 RepID=A0A1M7ZFJ4_9HYPH|nr:hydrogen peroxide-inducible genes activator [Pseudoxanthobacter soli]SHO63612.1 LysR family transcriptional regulator, hydrogen peroxide-inducible genes activator [Pseudoxanthobacter soli DSM 19599]
MSALPTIRQMQYFVALAEHRSFSRAAEICHVTQSTLSAAIRAFEEVMEADLVDRSSRVVALTAAGEAVLQRVRGILADTEALVGLARPAGAPLSGKMRLGVIPSIAPFLLPRALPSLREAYPALKLHLREDLTRGLIEDLREGRLDVILIAFPYAADNLEIEPLGEDRFFFVSAREHPLARRGAVRPADLGDEPLLLLEDGHCLRQHVLSAVGDGVLREQQDIRASSLTTLVQMVDNGLGVTLLPKVAIEGGVTAGTDLSIVPYDDPRAARTLALAWRRRSSRSEEFRALARHLSGFVGPHASSAAQPPARRPAAVTVARAS